LLCSWRFLFREYNGGYIKTLRQHIEHAPIITIGVGVVIENSKGEILLQKRKDNGKWAIIGGRMEIGDIVYSSSIIFRTQTYYGDIVNDPDEVVEHMLLGRDNLPEEINDFERLFIDI
jgi:hypothetical protein